MSGRKRNIPFRENLTTVKTDSEKWTTNSGVSGGSLNPVRASLDVRIWRLKTSEFDA